MTSWSSNSKYLSGATTELECKFQMNIMNKGNKTSPCGTVIAVDALADVIRFASPQREGNALVARAIAYTPRAFDKAFMEALGETVKQEMERNPNLDVQRVWLIMPDQLFLQDTVSIPVIHRKAMQQSLSLAVEAIYQNAEELNLMTYPVQQNKQTVTFGLVGVRREIINDLNNTFTDIGAPIHGITFASNAMVNGALALNSKLRNSTFLLLNIKEYCARFAFVVRGCTMGYYDLPFGYGVMREDVVCVEDGLFDHSPARRLVQDSIEHAHAKHQTSMLPAGTDSEQGASIETEGQSGRVLPKFMQRPAPQTAQECIYENFRVFLKWALELLNNNREITSIAKVDTVYINMPERYRFLFDVINKKHEGRGITFAPLLTEECDASLTDHLELYGGFFMNRFNEANTF